MSTNLRQKFKTYLQTSTSLNATVIEQLDDCIYQLAQEKASGKLTEIWYRNKCRFLSNNLTKNSASELIQQLNSGTITPQGLLSLEPHQFDASNWKNVLANRKYIAEQANKENIATTNDYKCGRCGRRKCTYFERQDRSADEPMTIHITCCHCGHKWKI